LLHQACAHCAKFPAAASRRSLGRVSVPVWLIVLSDQLPVDALVSRYLTNKLIGREPIPKRKSLSSTDLVVNRGHPVLIQVSLGYPGLRGRLLTCYSPVRRSVTGLVTRTCASLDLHALGTPPAFVLSQDQTLRRTFVIRSPWGTDQSCQYLSSPNLNGSRATWPEALYLVCEQHLLRDAVACRLLTRCLVVKEPCSVAQSLVERPTTLIAVDLCLQLGGLFRQRTPPKPRQRKENYSSPPFSQAIAGTVFSLPGRQPPPVQILQPPRR
jgi:hypothetical protein